MNRSLLFQLLFYSQVSETKTLFAGGYAGNGRVTRNTFTYNVKSSELLAGDPINVDYKQLGPLREPRKYMACGKFVENTGILVAVVVGGLDDSGNSLNTAEVYYDRYYINTKILGIVCNLKAQMFREILIWIQHKKVEKNLNPLMILLVIINDFSISISSKKLHTS